MNCGGDRNISKEVCLEVINDYRMVSLWEEMHKGHIGRDATYGNYKTKYYNMGLYSFVSDANKRYNKGFFSNCRYRGILKIGL
ncbi:hypothetical protein ACTFIT_007026 [Dictyostelium discoideum]